MSRTNVPEPLRRLAAALANLPSMGPRQAIRLSFYLARGKKEELREILSALEGMESLRPCTRCFFPHDDEGELCDICKDPSRNPSQIMILEKETDLSSIEKTAKFKGRYLLLGEIPKTGILEEWQRNRLNTFVLHIKDELGGTAEEIILGFNATSFGNLGATIVSKELAPHAKKLTRLGRGLPSGGEIEFADDETLESALEGRS